MQVITSEQANAMARAFAREFESILTRSIEKDFLKEFGCSLSCQWERATQQLISHKIDGSEFTSTESSWLSGYIVAYVRAIEFLKKME